MNLDAPTVALIGSALLFLGSMVTLLINRRGRKVDALSKLEEVVQKAQDRADKLYDEKVACEVQSEKYRAEIGAYLVVIADLKEALAEKVGFINGITDPLIKLEASHKAALAGGRRETDKP